MDRGRPSGICRFGKILASGELCGGGETDGGGCKIGTDRSRGGQSLFENSGSIVKSGRGAGNRQFVERGEGGHDSVPVALVGAVEKAAEGAGCFRAARWFHGYYSP